MSLKIHIDEIMKYFEELYSAREWLIKRSRDILTLCRKAIVSCLRESHETEKYVNELMSLFREFKEYAMKYPDLYYSNFYHAIESEYIEAIEFCTILREGRVLTHSELGVSPQSYIMGLLDLIGELKRYSLELIRREKYSESIKVYDIAENIYNQLEDFVFAENLVPGLKRKLDVYRKVLDDWKELLIDLVSRERLRKLFEQVKQSK